MGIILKLIFIGIKLVRRMKISGTLDSSSNEQIITNKTLERAPMKNPGRKVVISYFLL